jgi:hypothetical protein
MGTKHPMFPNSSSLIELDSSITHSPRHVPPSTYFCCGQQLTQKLEITLEASELEPITQQLTQN